MSEAGPRVESNTHTDETIRSFQQLRFRRMLWGFTAQLLTIFIVVALFSYGMLPSWVVGVYLSVTLLASSSFLLLLKTNTNLRFKDPSMTAGQILVPLLPSIFVMFFVTDPQARTAFLLTATSGLVFGMFALARSGMLILSMLIAGAYLLLLVALTLFAPQRINWQVESVMVFSYFAVLVTISYLTSFIAAMRRKLREQNHRLEQLVIRDPLTELPNRRCLMERLTSEMSRFERRTPEPSSLCISMLDVDHFKRINDTLGHDVGDTVLRRISETLSNALRKSDFVGRFGGEEFVVILPESSLEQAEQSVMRLQEAVAALEIPELPNGQRVTVSQGLTRYYPGERIEQTLKRADEALYRAKAAGRNCIIVVDPDDEDPFLN